MGHSGGCSSSGGGVEQEGGASTFLLLLPRLCQPLTLATLNLLLLTGGAGKALAQDTFLACRRDCVCSPWRSDVLCPRMSGSCCTI